MSSVGLKVMITYATEAVRQLHVDHRRCRFWDESNLEVSPTYTVNLCHSQCRAKLAIKLCGCVPFFYVGVQRGKESARTTRSVTAEEAFVFKSKIQSLAFIKKIIAQCDLQNIDSFRVYFRLFFVLIENNEIVQLFQLQ
jgi:hypothetical protein